MLPFPHGLPLHIWRALLDKTAGFCLRCPSYFHYFRFTLLTSLHANSSTLQPLNFLSQKEDTSSWDWSLVTKLDSSTSEICTCECALYTLQNVGQKVKWVVLTILREKNHIFLCIFANGIHSKRFLIQIAIRYQNMEEIRRIVSILTQYSRSYTSLKDLWKS